MIKIKILDKDYKYSIIPHETITFNGGEPHIKLNIDSIIKISKASDELILDTWIQSFNNLGELICLVDAIRRINTYSRLILLLGYFPGARQDRINNDGEHLTVKIYADIINSLKFDSVEICDPHSDVTPALLNNCVLYPIAEDVISSVIADCNPDFIISPDAGSTKRIDKYMYEINCHLPVIQCLKKRDTKTGKLSGFEVCAKKEDIENKKGLIIDDMIDGGGTFIGLAETIDNMTDKDKDGDLYLYATHGIFSQGYDKLLGMFDKIYTTDSFIPKEPPPERVKVYPLYD